MEEIEIEITRKYGSGIMHSLHNLMCMEHCGHTFFHKNDITIDDTQLPLFFDYCSQVVEAFLDIMAEYGIEFSYQEFYVINELIDNFSILLGDDDPATFLPAKKKLQEIIIPAFRTLMNHFADCVEEPNELKTFYPSLASKVQQAFNVHILGEE